MRGTTNLTALCSLFTAEHVDREYIMLLKVHADSRSFILLLRGQSHCRDSGRLITSNDTSAIIFKVFMTGAPPFLREGLEMFKTFMVDELLIYIRTVFSQ